MAEHYCNEHQQPFFKRGAMKGYAHPFFDENGDKKWCNEPSGEKIIRTPADLPKEGKIIPKVGKSEPPHLKEMPEIAPQERGMWWKHKAFALSYAKDLVCAGAIDKDEMYKSAQQMLDWLNKPMV